MAKGRKGGPSRLDKRREVEAYEKRQEDDEREDTEEEEEEEDDEEGDSEGEADVDAEIDDAEVDADADADDENAKPKRKKAAKKAPKKPAAKKATTKRSRAAKEVRTRAVWVVFDNGSKVVEKFPYNQKAGAEALLAKKLEEKKGTFYINLVKEEIKE